MRPRTTMPSSPPQRSSPLNAVKCSASKDQAARQRSAQRGPGAGHPCPARDRSGLGLAVAQGLRQVRHGSQPCHRRWAGGAARQSAVAVGLSCARGSHAAGPWSRGACHDGSGSERLRRAALGRAGGGTTGVLQEVAGLFPSETCGRHQRPAPRQTARDWLRPTWLRLPRSDPSSQEAATLSNQRNGKGIPRPRTKFNKNRFLNLTWITERSDSEDTAALPRTVRGPGPATALLPAQEIEKISATAAMLPPTFIQRERDSRFE